MKTYRFGHYQETVDGKKFITERSAKYDSDAQAELEARRFANKNNMKGVTIKRGDATWYISA